MSTATPETPAVVYPGNIETHVSVHELNAAQRDQHIRQQQAADATSAIKVFKLEAKTALTRKVASASKALEDAKAARNKGGEQLNKDVRAFALKVDRADKSSAALVKALNDFFPNAEMTVNRLLPHEPSLVAVSGNVTCDVEEWLVEGEQLAARVSISTSVSIPAPTTNEHGSVKDGWNREVVLDAKLTKEVRAQLQRIAEVKQLDAAHKAAKLELDQLDQHADLLEAQAIRQQLEATGAGGKKLLDSIDAAKAAVASGNWLALEGPATQAPAALPAAAAESDAAPTPKARKNM